MNQTDTLSNILRSLDRAEKEIERLKRSPAGSGVLRLKQQASDLSGITGFVVVYCKDNRIFSIDEDDNVTQLVPSDGWLNAYETWTYASASTITVPSGAASKYTVGMPIRWKQGGSYKYAYIVGVADTLLTVTGGSDYSVANSAITDNYYSLSENPIGFPVWFNYAGVNTGFASGYEPSAALAIYRFYIRSNVCFLYIRQSSPGKSNSTSFSISLPVTAKTMNYMVKNAVMRFVNGTLSSTYGLMEIGSGGTDVSLYTTASNGTWNNTGDKRLVTGFIEYEIG